jgi:peroxiredoxin
MFCMRLWIAGLILLVGTLFAGLANAATPLGEVKEFSLPVASGGTQTFRDWQGAKAVVLFFLGTECPVSNGYAPEMRRLAEKYQAKGVEFRGVHCDPDVTPQAALAHAAEYALPLTMLMDHDQVLAGQCGARVTPEAIIVSPDGHLAYRGRIDNRYAAGGKRRLEATTHDLEDALEAVLAGKTPTTTETEAFGCPLPRLRKTTPAAAK